MKHSDGSVDGRVCYNLFSRNGLYWFFKEAILQNLQYVIIDTWGQIRNLFGYSWYSE